MTSLNPTLPNIRKLFIPDPGHFIADCDLSGADAQVVAWEANDEELKAAFRAGLKVHAENAKAMFGSAAGPDGKREPYYLNTKRAVHATNYGARPAALAAANAWSMYESEKFQKRWFDMHPAILQWHKTIQSQIYATRSVSNKFGYTRRYFDRIQDLLKEALAWIPQSTVACVTNRGLVNVDSRLPEVQILLQVHDSLVVQFPKPYLPHRHRIRDEMLITIPYDDPLIIPISIKLSDKSWGDCKPITWE